MVNIKRLMYIYNMSIYSSTLQVSHYEVALAFIVEFFVSSKKITVNTYEWECPYIVNRILEEIMNTYLNENARETRLQSRCLY